MKTHKASVLFLAIAVVGVHPAHAVELLTSGNFETPEGIGEVLNWTLEEFATGSAQAVDSASLTGGADAQIFLRAFEGGGPLHSRQGNFDEDSLPQGDVDGVDFLAWQRGFGKTFGALPSEGDATGGVGGIPDGRVNASDYNIWKANFGKGAPLLTNARLSQEVAGTAGETYTFRGFSKFEPNYSGYVATLGSDSPFGQIPTPTTTTFRMEFLNGSGNPIAGSTQTLNLRTDLGANDPDLFFEHTPLTGVAPAGTVEVRVVAEALNMAWNGTAGPAPGGTLGAKQSAFFNDFSLTGLVTGGTNLLTNGNLNTPLPSALDFWNQVETPPTVTGILSTASFANHTPGGTLGTWLSAFYGSHVDFQPNPVDGVMSQTVPAVAGGVYNFSGWSYFEENYSGGVDTISLTSGSDRDPGLLAGQTSPTVTEIRLEFLDQAQTTILGSQAIDIKADRRLKSPTGVANDLTWYEHTLNNVVAPPGTKFARLKAQMLQGVYNTDPKQSAFFDDFSLTGPPPPIAAVPEPSSLVGLALGACILRRRRTRKS